jgi:hypothetical protein
LHCFEQRALELPATGRAISINSTNATVQRSAGLGKTVGNGRAPGDEWGKRDTERAEFRSVVAGLKLNVLEQHTVAAQAAIRTQMVNRGFLRQGFFWSGHGWLQII